MAQIFTFKLTTWLPWLPLQCVGNLRAQLIFVTFAPILVALVVGAAITASSPAARTAIADAVVQAHACYVGASHVLAYSRSFESPSVTTVELSPSAKPSALGGGAPCVIGVSAKCLVAGAA